jgi:hypothetical protein
MYIANMILMFSLEEFETMQLVTKSTLNVYALIQSIGHKSSNYEVNRLRLYVYIYVCIHIYIYIYISI